MYPTEEERQEYLASPEWEARRDACLTDARGVCYICRGLAEQAHHLTYERWRNELPEDLMALCDRCHEAVSGKSGVLGWCHGVPELMADCPCPQCRYDREMAELEARQYQQYARRMRRMLKVRRESDLMAAATQKELDERYS